MKTNYTKLRQIGFWIAYATGILGLGFLWLWAHVPQTGTREELIFVFVLWCVIAGTFLFAVRMAKELWKIGFPLAEESPVTIIHLIVLTAWLGLILAHRRQSAPLYTRFNYPPE